MKHYRGRRSVTQDRGAQSSTIGLVLTKVKCLLKSSLMICFSIRPNSSLYRVLLQRAQMELQKKHALSILS